MCTAVLNILISRKNLTPASPPDLDDLLYISTHNFLPQASFSFVVFQVASMNSAYCFSHLYSELHELGALHQSSNYSETGYNSCVR